MSEEKATVVRISPELRPLLDAAAAAGFRSLAQEVNLRLTESFAAPAEMWIPQEGMAVIDEDNRLWVIDEMYIVDKVLQLKVVHLGSYKVIPAKTVSPYKLKVTG